MAAPSVSANTRMLINLFGSTDLLVWRRDIPDFLRTRDIYVNRSYYASNYQHNTTFLVDAAHRGAFEGTLEIMRLLLEMGADVNATDEDGRSAMDYAVGETVGTFSPEIIALLLEHGASSADRDGIPWIGAIEQQVSISPYIMRSDPDVERIFSFFRQPAVKAARVGHLSGQARMDWSDDELRSALKLHKGDIKATAQFLMNRENS